MSRSLPLLAAALVALLAPCGARGAWSTPLALTRASGWPGAVAADSAGDAAAAWVTQTGRVPSSINRSCALHPFQQRCYPTTHVHLAVRSKSGQLVARTVWTGKSGQVGMSLAIAHGQVTLGWGAYDVSDPNETAREVHGPLLGHWSHARVLGRFLDYLLTGGHAPIYPQMAVAPNGTVLAAWSACGSLQRCPGAIPGVTLAWRAPGQAFGRPYEVSAAPEGSVPSFDSAGRAYLHSSGSARVLLAAPGSHSFRRVVTLARGAVRDLSLGLSGAGEGLASWISPGHAVNQAAGPTAGPVLASRLAGGVFAAPVTVTPAGVAAQDSESVAVGGGGVVGWVGIDRFGVPFGTNVSLGSAPALPAGAAPLAADGGGDIAFGRQRIALSTLALAVLPAGGTAAQPSVAQIAAIGAAPFGRTVAIGWSEPRGPLELSAWRP